jgi:hypothetical protein
VSEVDEAERLCRRAAQASPGPFRPNPSRSVSHVQSHQLQRAPPVPSWPEVTPAGVAASACLVIFTASMFAPVTLVGAAVGAERRHHKCLSQGASTHKESTSQLSIRDPRHNARSRGRAIDAEEGAR